MTLYATDWRYEPEPRANAPEEHHIVGGETADGRRIIIAEIERDRDGNFDARMSDAEAAEIARLIAAAPDLLDALSHLVGVADAVADATNCGDMDAAILAAHAAIARAEESE